MANTPYYTKAESDALNQELESRFKAINPSHTFDSESDMTTYWNNAPEKPEDTTDLYRKDLNQIWSWDSSVTEKAVFSREFLKKATEISAGNTGLAVSGDVAYHITPVTITCSPSALNINGSGGTWTLDVAEATINFRFKSQNKNNIAVSKSLSDTYNYLIFNFTSGDIEIYTSQSTAVNLLKNKDNEIN